MSRLDEPDEREVRVSPISFGGIRRFKNWNGFAGYGRGKATPKRVRHANPKHAKRRARLARRAAR